MQRTTGRYEVWVNLIEDEWFVLERFRHLAHAREYAYRAIDNLRGGKVQVVDCAENDRIVFQWIDGDVKVGA